MKITIPQNEIEVANSKYYKGHKTSFNQGIELALSKVNERLSPVLDNVENTLNSVRTIAENEGWEKAFTGRQLVFKEIEKVLQEIKQLTKPEYKWKF